MFDDSSQESAAPTRGPLPGAPLSPFAGSGGTSMPAAVISPEGTPPMPPSTFGAQVLKPGKGGGRKRLILIVALVVVLLGGGVAVAALLFPSNTPAANTVVTNTTNTANTNKTSNQNKVVNTTPANTTSNTNSVLPGANTNGSSNLNTVITNTVNTNITTPSNLNTNFSVTNSSGNTNVVANANTTVNTNTSSTLPVSYSSDTDGDKFNNYLEEWLGTNPNNADSDGDGFPDGQEVAGGYSPLGAGDLRVVALESSCARNALVAQYKLPSTDVASLCSISGSLLASVQVMASGSNPELYEDLDGLFSKSCTAYGRITEGECRNVVRFVLTAYMTAPKAS